MRLLLSALAGLVLAVTAMPAAAQGRRPPAYLAVQPGTMITWSRERHPRPVRYRAGDVTLEVSAVGDDGLWRPRIAIRRGSATAVLNGAAAQPTYEHKFGIGTLNRAGMRFVYLQSFTGGAHCCNDLQVAVIGPRGIRVVQLGTFDGGPTDEFPRDLDGDGNIDFVQQDDSFLYTFSSYAGSMAPPRIFNINGGHVNDVSTRPSFRRLFRQAMNRRGGIA